MNEDYTRNILSSPYQSDLSSIVCTSQPYCLFRNHSKYIYQSQTHSFQTALKSKWLNKRKGNLKVVAENQSNYYDEFVNDFYIPPQLLKDTFELDFREQYDHSKVKERSNTVTSFYNNDDNYLIYCSGSNMDELTVRNSTFLLPQYCYPCQPSFSINVGNGSHLRQVVTGGKTDFGTKVNLLTRTGSKIYYLQAMQIDDFLDCSSIPSTCVLDLKAKTQIPEEISDLCGSSSDWSYAVAITKTGKLYTWNPLQGVRCHSSSSLFNPTPSSSSTPTTSPNLISLSNHPSIVLHALSSSVYSYDLRSSPGNNSQSRLLYSSNNPVVALSHHQNHPFHFMISTNQSLLFMDSRFSKQCLYRQYLGEDQEDIRSYHLQSFTNENKSSRSLGKTHITPL
jgi:hypothetical protein